MPIRMEDTHVELIEQGVPRHEQTMTIEKPFWAFFTGNMIVAVWLIGVFIGGYGLSVGQSILIVLVGNLIGGIPIALLAQMGPRTGLSQVEASRLSLGKAGSRISGLLNWINCIGWDAINNVSSAAALVALLAYYSFTLPFWLGLGLIVLVQMAIGIYGHHLVQFTTKYVGWFFFVAIAAIGIKLLSHGLPVSPTEPPTIKNIVMAFSLSVVGLLAFAPYISDYTRYLPATTPPKKVFAVVFGGNYLSMVVLECFGVLTANIITDQTPHGFMTTFAGLAGSFAPLVLLIIAISSTPANAMNDNSAAYCFISSGIRLPRPVSAIIGAVAGYGLASWSAGRFAEAMENYLFFIFYWMAPWTAIVLVHWFWIGRHQTDHPYATGWTRAATIFVVTTIVSIGLFSASPIYTSPVAKALGGIDIGYYVGFLVAGLWYAATLRKKT